MPVLRTVGHGTLSASALGALVVAAGIERVVDVRRFPGSRRHPHFASEEMARWLPDHGLEYEWMPSLGGRRTRRPDSPNTGLRNAQFQAYADHMATAEFRAAVDELLAAGAQRCVAVMCAESVWWRCHRRLLADHLDLVEGVDVEHVLPDGRLSPHAPTEGARREGDHVVYDMASQAPLL